MYKSRTDHILVTHEELAALNGNDSSEVLSGDQGFKYRLLFLLTLVVMQTTRLLFYPHVAVTQFQAGAMDEASLHHYMTIRAFFVMAISAIYLFSYLKDWYFERIAMLVVGVAITALVMDYFNAYIYLSDQPAPKTAALIVVRFLAIYCLVMNALRAREAPAMPRSLWS